MDNNMVNELLISLVFDKPALWDKKHKLHSKRNVIAKCWKEISLEMNLDEITLRKKWRYLRDQFAVELGKIQPGSGDEAISVYPKWPYFNQLLFLKAVVKPRIVTRNSTRSRHTSSVDTDQDAQTVDSQSTHDSLLDQESNNESGQQISSPGPSRQTTTKRPKKSYSDEISDIKIQKLQFLLDKEKSRQKRQDEEDENLLFFKSLLPHVNKIPQDMILLFRNRIQDVVGEFAYPSQ